MVTTLFTGAGSQPVDEDGATLQYMEMPSEMRTYAQPALPEPEDAVGIEPGVKVLERVLGLLETHKEDGPHNIVELNGLDAESAAFVNQALGDGEVSVIGGDRLQAQEAVLAGVWRIREVDATGKVQRDLIEVASFPTAVSSRTFAGSAVSVALPESFGPGVFNSPPLVAEINDRIAAPPGKDPHVINLSLLPHTEQDLALLDAVLGKGWLTVLSRGYGNCRVKSTTTKNVWWVQFFNSQDTLILNTIEVTSIPEVVTAAPEDIRDSAARLREILEVYQ